MGCDIKRAHTHGQNVVACKSYLARLAASTGRTTIYIYTSIYIEDDHFRIIKSIKLYIHIYGHYAQRQRQATRHSCHTVQHNCGEINRPFSRERPRPTTAPACSRLVTRFITHTHLYIRSKTPGASTHASAIILVALQPPKSSSTHTRCAYLSSFPLGGGCAESDPLSMYVCIYGQM